MARFHEWTAPFFFAREGTGTGTAPWSRGRPDDFHDNAPRERFNNLVRKNQALHGHQVVTDVDFGEIVPGGVFDYRDLGRARDGFSFGSPLLPPPRGPRSCPRLLEILFRDFLRFARQGLPNRCVAVVEYARLELFHRETEPGLEEWGVVGELD